MPGFNGSLCSEVINRRIAAFQSYNQYKHKKQRSELVQQTHGIFEIAAHLRADIEIICKIRRRFTSDDRISCARTGAILAHSNNALASAVVADLNQVAAVFDLNEKVVGKCWNGQWVGVPIDPKLEFEAGGISSVGVIALVKACANIKAEEDSGNGSGGGIRGISGITGLDSLGGTCGMQISSGVTSQQVMADGMRLIADMAKQCPYDPKTGVMDTGDEGAGDASGNTDAAEPTVTDNGDGTQTVCTEHGCYVEYADGGTSSGTSGTPAPSSATDAGPCTDPNGCTSDDGYDQVTVYPDGTIITKQRLGEPGDDADIIYRIELPNGNWLYFSCHNGSCEDPVIGWNPGTGPEDCLDETCNSCRNFSNFSPKLIESCGKGAGADIALCGEFVETANCCANPNATTVDPRIVYPNQGGDMVCANLSKPKVKDICETRCSVASSHEDCQANCLRSQEFAVFELSVVDQVCPYAYSEDCFSSEIDFGEIMPSTGGPGGLPPLPVTWGDSYFVNLNSRP